ncbi:hypothetical protein E2C01_018619 [Portunus trituberculatus]|uniref:Uncharacterized protein n=1 Tax=Portunus trituberculatus TaxID=210409 RepID=A0A5B7DUZ9_PORTR|nr:hypothetical protein [Portunus trituberculatus]
MLSPFHCCWAPPDHNLIFVSCPISPIPPQDLPKQRYLWYYVDFPRNDYCFSVRNPSFCAERMTEVIVSGMEVYIPHSFLNPNLLNFLFNTACSRAIHDREVAHLLNPTHFMFLSRIMPCLFLNLPNTPS